MIERIVIENFESLRKVDLSLGRMNLFIGANATGKSNVLGAFRGQRPDDRPVTGKPAAVVSVVSRIAVPARSNRCIPSRTAWSG